VGRRAGLEAGNEALPTIVLGDFNAHRAMDTHEAADDWTLIGDVFATHPELALQRIDYPFENTYRDKEGKAYKLDHIFVGGGEASSPVEVAGPCNLAWPADQTTIEQHFDQISDHCPVVATVTLTR